MSLSKSTLDELNTVLSDKNIIIVNTVPYYVIRNTLGQFLGMNIHAERCWCVNVEDEDVIDFKYQTEADNYMRRHKMGDMVFSVKPKVSLELYDSGKLIETSYESNYCDDEIPDDYCDCNEIPDDLELSD
jgi:hypothetical protein